MKNIITKSILIFLFGVLLCQGRVQATQNSTGYEYHIKYEREDLTLASFEKDDRAYTSITLKDLQNGGEIGQPSLPIQNLCISIPSNADNLRISTRVNERQTISIEGCPLPEQEPQLANINSKETAFINLSHDLSSINTPTEIKASILSTSIYGGCHRLVYVNFNPVIWNRYENTIDFATDVTLSLTWDINPDLSEKLIIPKYQSTTENTISKIRQFVVNPDDVRDNTPSAGSNRQYVGSMEDLRIPYIIVTTKELSSSLERLAALRRLRGISTQVRCIEDILSNPLYIAKAQEDEYKDNASILRAFVSDAYYTHGTEYILLAGPYPIIPGRWAQRVLNPHIDDTYISDFYFRNVDVSWPKIADRHPLPEELNNFENYINVSRIPCSTSDEINNYIDKLIQYEFNIGNVDLSYLNNAFVLFGEDTDIKKFFYNDSYDSFSDNFSFLKIDTNGLTSTYTGAEAVKSMNSNYWGYVDWRCHGHYAGLATHNPTYGINAVDNFKGSFGAEEDSNGLDNWNNYLRPCWTISMSCNLSELRIEYSNVYNVAQSFILGKNYGGIAFIANYGPGYKKESSFLSQQIFQSCVEKANRGNTIPYSSIILNDGLDIIDKTGKKYQYLITTIGLTGDPLVPLWLKEPYKSARNGMFYPETIHHLAKVVYGKNYFNNSFSQTGEGIITEYKGISPTKNYTLLNYRSDMIPYLHPCEISNLSIDKDGYWFTGKLTLKSDVNGSNSIKISNRTSSTFECLDEVNMSGLVDIASGSSLSIKAHRNISAKNCVIQGNGNILIDSYKNVILGEGTTISKGTCISIK